MPDFYHPERNTTKWGERLPHWQQHQTAQFVTFRLGDALPKEKVKTFMERRHLWLLAHPEPRTPETESEYHRRFTWRIERWLDQGAGSCLLKDRPMRDIVSDVLMKFDGTRVLHHAWIIMPNHVHLLFSPLDDMGKLIGAWKSRSANDMGKGPVWQRNYRDTLIRDAGHFANAVRYIRRNPVKARLHPDEFTLWQSEQALLIP